MDETKREALLSYKMPEASVGLPVVWYKTGRRNRQLSEVAYMIHCGSRTVTLHCSSGRRMDAVRHVDDPKLDLNADQREQGAWDFSEDYKDTITFRAKVLERLDHLESSLLQDKDNDGKSDEMAGGRFREYRELRQRAVDMGILIRKGDKKEDIVRAITKKLAGNVPAQQAVN